MDIYFGVMRRFMEEIAEFQRKNIFLKFRRISGPLFISREAV